MDKKSSKEPGVANRGSDSALRPFLTKYMPSQLSSNPRKLCYRHSPENLKRRARDEITIDDLQAQMDRLPMDDKAAITHVWTLFSAAPASQRLLILQGLLTICCMPQLSFLASAVKPLLRIDFLSILPTEISLKILSYLDASSLCHAAQVCKSWKALADDDVVWHRMCEQHIDKKCTKCGWGLPLLDKKRKHIQQTSKQVMARNHGGPATAKRVAESVAPTSAPVDDQNVELRVQALRNACGTDVNPAVSGNIGYERPAKRARTVTPPPGPSTGNGDAVTPSISASSPLLPATVDDPARAKPLLPKRPWKDVYSERLIVERNWRKNNYDVRTLKGHTDGIMCLDFCESQNVLITGSRDRTIRVWDLETGEQLRELQGHTRSVRALQFDDAKLISGSLDRTLKIWNYHTGQCIRTLEGHRDGIVCLHYDSRLLASGAADATIKVWNFETSECFTLRGHTDWVNSVRIYQGGMLISGSDDTTIRLWDLESRQCVKVLQGHVGQVQSIAPSPHGFTHTFSEDIISMDTPHTTSTIIPSDAPSDLSFLQACAANLTPEIISPQAATPTTRSDTPILISGSLDNTIRIWSLTTGACLRTLFGHIEGVWSVALDKLRLVSASYDSTVKVWDVESGRCLHTLSGHRGSVNCVSLSDARIISGGDDGEIRIWDYRAVNDNNV